VLDPALMRPGRFDRQVLVDKPDVKGREQILRIHARTVKLAGDVDLAVIARAHGRFAGADLANLGERRPLAGARRDKTAADRRTSTRRSIASSPAWKRSGAMNPRVRRIVARPRIRPRHRGYRAAGRRPGAQGLNRRSADSAALGYTMQLPTEDRIC
jgi:cell division protease FtsH